MLSLHPTLTAAISIHCKQMIPAKALLPHLAFLRIIFISWTRGLETTIPLCGLGTAIYVPWQDVQEDSTDPSVCATSGRHSIICRLRQQYSFLHYPGFRNRPQRKFDRRPYHYVYMPLSNPDFVCALCWWPHNYFFYSFPPPTTTNRPITTQRGVSPRTTLYAHRRWCITTSQRIPSSQTTCTTILLGSLSTSACAQLIQEVYWHPHSIQTSFRALIIHLGLPQLQLPQVKPSPESNCFFNILAIAYSGQWNLAELPL